ncbi:metalloregulator ArsR/SmtB family transcription factor [Methanobrevibacter sp. OttesenSCG-928-K11]|nr:metalloregulator ArsR/SmtB family transcription factor [Methanobrevibacter sp. OttesenSCG-928-K11]MDL2271137.1 metalloregulator ArsR/SmtB family transcription factor [Methanobrevibacter sp. OttesenSCG-928-I08]
MSGSDVCELKSIRQDLVEEISEKMESDEVIEDTSNLFKILSDYNRIRIISALKHHELCVCELSLLLDMSQSSISHQLRHLRHNNIVKFRKEQKQIFYSLVDDEIFDLIKKGEEYESK